MSLARPQEETFELFTFTVGAHRYAVDLARVDEVLPPVNVTPASDARPPVLGCVSLRGERVPVVELRQCLLEGAAKEGARPAFLVVRLGRRRVAFCIDGVGGVLAVALASLRLPPTALDVSTAVVAVWAQPSGVHFLLDLCEVLREQSRLPPGTG